MTNKVKPKKCPGTHGYANPRKLDIACLCDGCKGRLESDAINAVRTLGYLACSTCGCRYEIAAHGVGVRR